MSNKFREQNWIDSVFHIKVRYQFLISAYLHVKNMVRINFVYNLHKMPQKKNSVQSHNHNFSSLHFKMHFRSSSNIVLYTTLTFATHFRLHHVYINFTFHLTYVENIPFVYTKSRCYLSFSPYISPLFMYLTLISFTQSRKYMKSVSSNV